MNELMLLLRKKYHKIPSYIYHQVKMRFIYPPIAILGNMYTLADKKIQRLKLSSAGITEKTLNRLHLGCGAIKIDGYCNVDIDALIAPDNFAEIIYSCHVLEHIGHEEVLPTLRNWYRVLKPGGEVRISVPDLDRIVNIYKNNWAHFQTKTHSPWIGLIYGGQSDKFDFHKTGFNLTWLSYLLESVGFADIEEYSHVPHFIPGVEDASMANATFGEYISLNVKAIKPKICEKE